MKFTNASVCATLAAVSFIDAGLTIFIAWQYAYDAATWIEATFVVLALLGLAASLIILGRFSRRVTTSFVVPWAVAVGIFLGSLWVVEILVNNVVTPPLPARDIIDNSFWAAIELIALAGAFAITLRSRRIIHGIEFGVWSGFVSGLIACTAALALVTFGMRLVTADLLNVAEWAELGGQSGAPSIAHYFAFETMAGALGHLLVLGVGLGMLVGFMGGCIAMLAARWLLPSTHAADNRRTK